MSESIPTDAAGVTDSADGATTDSAATAPAVEFDTTDAAGVTQLPTATDGADDGTPTTDDTSQPASLFDLSLAEQVALERLQTVQDRIAAAGGVVTPDDEAELDDVWDAFDLASADTRAKLDRYGFVVARAKEDAGTIQAKLAPVKLLADGLSARLRSRLAVVERLNARVQDHLVASGQRSVEGAHWTWRLQANGGALAWQFVSPAHVAESAAAGTVPLVTLDTAGLLRLVESGDVSVADVPLQTVVDMNAVDELWNDAVEAARADADSYAEDLAAQAKAAPRADRVSAVDRKAMVERFRQDALLRYLPAWLRPAPRGEHVRLA